MIVSCTVLLLVLCTSLNYAETSQEILSAAMRAYDNKEFQKCANLYELLFKLTIQKGDTLKDSQATYWNAAGCSALAGNKDRAFELLHVAIKEGIRGSESFIDNADLISLYQDARWQQLLSVADAAKQQYLNSINKEVLELFNADQEDRSGNDNKIDWKKVSARDHQRRIRVKQIIEASGLKVADDYVHAAFIFQHGEKSSDYLMAHELGMKGAELDPKNMDAKWIAAAAKDRYLRSIGKPQIYGTQFRKIEGIWTLEPIDEKALTDEERAKMGVPSIQETMKNLEQMNRKRE